jgi:single stranded DNA-binding protein
LSAESKGKKMSDINRTMLLGRLGTDPVLRLTKTGIPVASFSMATEIYLKSKDESETTWHKVVVWGKTAQRCVDELKKGMSTFVDGHMKVRKFQNEAGVVLYFHEVHAERVHFVHRMGNPKPSQEELDSKIEVGGLEHEPSLEDITH